MVNHIYDDDDYPFSEAQKINYTEIMKATLGDKEAKEAVDDYVAKIKEEEKIRRREMIFCTLFHGYGTSFTDNFSVAAKSTIDRAYIAIYNEEP